jgi:hypothetical protein
MSLKANVTVVSWRTRSSLGKELHQRELAAVAEEIARSVPRAILLPTNLRGRDVFMYREKEVRSTCARVYGIVFCLCCGGAEPHFNATGHTLWMNLDLRV